MHAQMTVEAVHSPPPVYFAMLHFAQLLQDTMRLHSAWPELLE
jgi:hypothetical protein